MSEINKDVDHLINKFKNMTEWEERYKALIDMGKEAPSLKEEQKTKDNLVSGCQSQVWLTAHLNDEQKVVFEADSDALIAKGLVSFLVKIFSNHTPKEIIELNTDFISEIGLDTHLSANRSQGLMAMIKQMKYYGTAFQALLSQKF